MYKISVLIVDDISDTRESIRRLLEFEKEIEVVGEASTGSEALRLAEDIRPDILLMDINMPEMDGIRTTELLATRVPEATVVMMSVQGEQAYMRRAMMAGAKEYIIKPFTGSELANTIYKVYDIQQQKKIAMGVEPVPTATVTHPKRKGSIISFFSTKGGVGKTTLATNYAAELAANGKYKVLLVDLNLQFGDVSVFLNLVPRRTIADLVQIESMKYMDIQPYILTHSSGLQVLAAPTRPEYYELIHANHVEGILAEVKDHFDYIIIDNTSRFDDISLTALDASEQIMLVVEMNVPTLKNAKLSLEVLEGLKFTSKVRLIVNRYSKEIGLGLSDAEKSLNFKVSAHIPSDGKTLIEAVNQGTPFVKSHAQCKPAEAIRQMIRDLTDPAPEAKQEISQKETKYFPVRRIKQLFSF